MNKPAMRVQASRISSSKKRLRGFRYLGEHRAREGKGSWEKFYVWTSKGRRAVVFKLVERSPKPLRRLARRPRGKGLRALRRKLRTYALIGAGLFGAMYWLGRSRAAE